MDLDRCRIWSKLDYWRDNTILRLFDVEAGPFNAK